MAGIFGFMDPSRPGKGVRKDEPPRSHFVRFFTLLQRKFWKLIQLNFLFLLFSVPIVTIGPAAAAMTRVLRDFATERPVFLLSDFWDAFKSNFKQAFIYELVAAATAYLTWIAWQFYNLGAADNAWFYAPLVLVFIIALYCLFANFYILLMIVTIDLPLKSIFRNAFLFAALGLKRNFCTLFFGALTIFGLWYIYFIGYLLYFVIGFAFLGFIIVYNAYPTLKKYVIDPYLSDDKGKNADGNVFTDEFAGE